MKHWLDMVVILLQAPTANLRELAHLAGADPRNFYVGVDVQSLDLTDQDTKGMSFSSVEGQEEQEQQGPTVSELIYEGIARVVDATRAIRRSTRQEERIVLLLDEIIKNRSLAIDIIDMYDADRGKPAAEALTLLRQKLQGDKKLTNVQLARIVSGRFAKSPQRRTTLAYFMFKHLRKYPDIGEWLEGKSINRTYLGSAHWADFEKLRKAHPS